MAATPTVSSYDGVEIAYHIFGEGEPLVVLPGGPGRPSGYLGDLGGLSRSRQLILMDPRGTGDSATPADEGTYRVDRQARDVEALVDHLDLDTVDVLGHSAGASMAVMFAAEHPERLRRLILVTPSGRVLGVPTIGFEEAVAARSAEPWFADAIAAEAALEVLPDDADIAERDELLARVTPFFYGRWDAAAEAHSIAFPHVDVAAAGYYRDFTSDAPAVRALLAALTAPTLVVAGEVDGMPTPAVADMIAKLFPNGRSATVPGGHYPWVDDPAAFVTTITEFLEA